MADIMSRIVLQAQGGDQVAREVGKIKRAYDEAGKSAQKISPKAVGGADVSTDAFDRAVTSPHQSNIATRQASNAEYDRRLNDRIGRHQQMAASNQQVGRQLRGGAAVSTAAATTAAAGDPVSGIGGAMQAMGGAGIAGAIVAGLGMMFMGVQKIAQKDIEKREQIFTGLGQQLGQNTYVQFREQTKLLQNAGLGTQLMPFMTSLAGAGGQFNLPMAEQALRFQFAYGVQAPVVGQMMGRLQQAGVAPEMMWSPAMRSMAEGGFGRAGMTAFYQTLTTAVEDAMGRGFEKGAGTFSVLTSDFARLLSGLAGAGLTPLGAQRAFTQMQQTFAGAEKGIRTPEDVWRFMMFKKPGQTYAETIRAMTDPSAIFETFRMVEAQAPTEGILEQMVASTFGVSLRLTPNVIETLRAGRVPAEIIPAAAMDEETLRRLGTEAERKNVLEGVTQGVGGFMAGLTDIFRGRPIGNVTTETERLILQQGTKGGRGGAMRNVNRALLDVRRGNITMEEFLLLFPEESRTFVESAATTGTLMTQTGLFGTNMQGGLLGLLGTYQASQTGGVLTPEETRMMKLISSGPGMGTLLGAMGGLEGVVGEKGIGAVEKALQDANKQNLDNLRLQFTIVDVLRAIEILMGQEVTTDTGSTE